ncbi:nitrile hydratase accessory protein [Teichococcus aestuarii]|uniref:Nitrile hydratase accessory protein n=1 Tax=Teichococcus aestuarii TaxID=568898 RepID=A0A2U1V149_9PROT|nr:nitrile hydratase accessory protein [Pseudoroseomonas aestuarii]PWC27613.1 nitrile hydratase accessory protein [Pseudoroseomonas aestuarii]
MKPEAMPAEAPGLPRDVAGPVFREPWEAQAFAMAVAAHQAGCFTWAEWTAALGRHLAACEAPYYAHWLAALEELLAEKGILSKAELAERQEAWARAAAATPHGQPILLPG